MAAVPPAVRILPMDSKSTPGFVDCAIEDVQQQFFLRELAAPDRLAGRYRFHNSGLRADPGTAVLFQYRGRIIASAILLSIESDDSASAPGGCFCFDMDSIQTFDPIDAGFLGKFWPQIKRLGQAKWSLDSRQYAKFQKKLTGVEKARSAD